MQQVGISKSQMIRYESKGGQPPAEALNKMAGIFNTSVDYLLNGNTDEKASQTIKDVLIPQKFKEVEQLFERKQNIILEIISAYIRDYKAKQAYK